jgi:cytochrome c oxidase subunit 2
MFLGIDIPMWPEAASANAAEVDKLYIFLIVVSVIMTAVIFVGVFAFAMKYRKKDPKYVPPHIHGSNLLEVGWTVAPFLVMLVMFAWGTKLYFDEYTIPATSDATDVYVVGKQWMWKVQYPEGQREINELHVPVGRKIRLTMASEDVIHSFFIPAFRLKRDVVPGHYNTAWFEATKPGRYHLFCAEYCGTEHSGMIGWVTVMEPADYENWLSGGGAEGSMASQGEKMFQQLGCSTCHLLDQQGRCPIMRGVYGSKVLLDNGKTVIADESYIRESILNPNAKIVAGFHADVMPTFQGQVSEETVLQLIAYIKSLAPKAGNTINGPAPAGTGPGMTTIPGRPGANGQAVRRDMRTDGKQ